MEYCTKWELKMNIPQTQFIPSWFYTMPNYKAKALERIIRHNPQACRKNKIPQGYGQFGLDRTNPIPVYGDPEIEVYLSKLRLNNGSKINWKKEENISASNIKQPIQKYQIYKQSGNLITSLYFSPYHLLTSNKAPKGFKIKT